MSTRPDEGLEWVVATAKARRRDPFVDDGESATGRPAPTTGRGAALGWAGWRRPRLPAGPGESGLYLGLGSGGWAWTGAERSTLVLGPSRSGKTSSLGHPERPRGAAERW